MRRYSWVLPSFVLALTLAGCSGTEIVIPNDPGERVSSAKFLVSTTTASREVEVRSGSPATLAPGEKISVGAHGEYVAGEKGGTIEIRDGRIVLKGMAEVK